MIWVSNTEPGPVDASVALFGTAPERLLRANPYNLWAYREQQGRTQESARLVPLVKFWPGL